MKTYKNVLYIYYLILISLFLITLAYIYSLFHNKKKKKQLRYKNGYRQILSKAKITSDEDIDTLFKRSGIKLTNRTYNKYRYYLFLVSIFMVTSIFFKSPKLLNYYLVIIVLYISSIPVLSLMNKKTIFSIVIDWFKKRYNEKINIELYSLLTQLKNIAINEDNLYSIEFMINQLLKSANLTKDLLSNYLLKYRTCREDEAIEYFLNRLNTPLSKDFLAIIMKLDKLAPGELINQIELAKFKFREDRNTKKKGKQESLSNLVFLPIYIPVLVIILNFVMIVLWIPTMGNGLSF
jgi:hypothetical protein